MCLYLSLYRDTFVSLYKDIYVCIINILYVWMCACDEGKKCIKFVSMHHFSNIILQRRVFLSRVAFLEKEKEEETCLKACDNSR